MKVLLLPIILQFSFLFLNFQSAHCTLLEFDKQIETDKTSSLSEKPNLAEQLIWLRIDVDKDQNLLSNALDIIQTKQIGGIIFTGHDLDAFIYCTNFIKTNSTQSTLVAINDEGGTGRQFNLQTCFPDNEVIAAISNRDIQKRTIQAISSQLKMLGIQINISGFKSQDTFNEMNSIFAENNIVLSSPGNGLVPNQIYRATTNSEKIEARPRLFRLNENLETEIKQFLQEIKKEYGNKLQKDELFRQYEEKLKHIRTITDIENTNIEPSDSILSSLFSNETKILSRQAYRFSSVLLKNENIIPIDKLGTRKIACVTFSSSPNEKHFQETLKKYTRIDCFNLSSKNTKSEIEKTINKLSNYNLIILGVFTTDSKTEAIVDKISKSNESIKCYFGSHETISNSTKAVILTLDTDSLAQSTAGQIVFGGINAEAQLPYPIANYPKGHGLKTDKQIRFEYTIPEMAGIDGNYLSHIIDSVANMAIGKQAFPGCQVLVAKDRKIIYHQSFGHHTYYKNEKVKNNDIYDLASVTKITGTLPALMQFVDQKKFNLDEIFSTYWIDFKNTNKENLNVREILAHQSGLQAWIPYWRNTVDKNGNFLPNIYRTEPNDTFCIQITQHLFLNKNYHKEMFRQINETPVSNEKKYVYSGLPFYIFPEIIRNNTHQDYPDYVIENFYRPLGSYNIVFNAHKEFPLNRIIPTEYDDFFRFSLLHGFVDDEGAAMMGGISGNAGLFSDANDLAKLMQMYLQMGEYGGDRFITEETMREFTRCQFPENDNRRGLGFDKPTLGNDTLSIKDCYPAYSASPSSFGHSGYTGTFVWCDPEYQLVYIFLSNRVYPSRKNTGIYDTNSRMLIHQGIYDAIEKFEERKKK